MHGPSQPVLSDQHAFRVCLWRRSAALLAGERRCALSSATRSVCRLPHRYRHARRRHALAVDDVWAIAIGRFRCFRVFITRGRSSLSPDLARFADPRGFEAGTVRGSQWSPAVFLGQSRPGIFWRRVVLFRLPEAAGQRRQLADQLNRDARACLGLLCGDGAVFDLQRGPAKRKPGGFQLPSERDRQLRNRAIRPALVIVCLDTVYHLR